MKNFPYKRTILKLVRMLQKAHEGNVPVVTENKPLAHCQQRSNSLKWNYKRNRYHPSWGFENVMGNKSTKLIKAEKMINEGKKIEIISEEDFIKML